MSWVKSQVVALEKMEYGKMEYLSLKGLFLQKFNRIYDKVLDIDVILISLSDEGKFINCHF